MCDSNSGPVALLKFVISSPYKKVYFAGWLLQALYVVIQNIKKLASNSGNFIELKNMQPLLETPKEI